MTITINGANASESNVPVVPNSTQGLIKAYQYILHPVVGAAGAVHGAITLPASGTTVVTTGITNPDFPRVLAITGGALLMAGNVVITGTDVSGASITDTIALSGNTQVAGALAFATVTSITVPTHVNIGDTVTIDTLNKFGMPSIIYVDLYVRLHLFNGSNDAGTVTVNATKLAGNFYNIAGTPDGTKTLVLGYWVA